MLGRFGVVLAGRARQVSTAAHTGPLPHKRAPITITASGRLIAATSDRLTRPTRPPLRFRRTAVALAWRPRRPVRTSEDDHVHARMKPDFRTSPGRPLPSSPKEVRRLLACYPRAGSRRLCPRTVSERRARPTAASRGGKRRADPWFRPRRFERYVTPRTQQRLQRPLVTKRQPTCAHPWSSREPQWPSAFGSVATRGPPGHPPRVGRSLGADAAAAGYGRGRLCGLGQH